jgi:hypothetical protein
MGPIILRCSSWIPTARLFLRSLLRERLIRRAAWKSQLYFAFGIFAGGDAGATVELFAELLAFDLLSAFLPARRRRYA